MHVSIRSALRIQKYNHKIPLHFNCYLHMTCLGIFFFFQVISFTYHRAILQRPIMMKMSIKYDARMHRC